MDRDVLSRNDWIGSTGVDTKQPLCGSGKLQRRKFDSVLRMDFAISRDVNAGLDYHTAEDTIVNLPIRIPADISGYKKK